MSNINHNIPVPPGYNAHDFYQALAFLEMQLEGHSFGSLISQAYLPEDPETWCRPHRNELYGDERDYIGFVWRKEPDGDECRLFSVRLSKTDAFKTALDLSGCSALKFLICNDTVFQGIDVSGCSNLERLACLHNNLEQLNLSGCGKLILLDASECLNENASLDLSDCTELQWLDCSYNGLVELDVSNCKKLYHLRCGCNNLAKLDLSQNGELTYLVCSGNKISALDTSNCLRLEELHCGNNLVSELDVSRNKQLHHLECGGVTKLLIGENPSLRAQSVKAEGNGVIQYRCRTDKPSFFSEEPHCVISISAECKDEETVFDGWYSSEGELVSHDDVLLSTHLAGKAFDDKKNADVKDFVRTQKYLAAVKPALVARFAPKNR